MSKRIIALFLSVFAVFGFAGDIFADAGESAGQIFLYNPDPVSAAMGDAGAALYSNKASGAILNPASTMNTYRPVLSASNSSLFSSIQYNYAGAQFPTNIGNFGLAVMYAGYTDMQYFNNSGQSVNMDSTNDMAFIINYSVPIKKSVPVESAYGGIGVNIKVLRSALGNYTTEAFAMDFGAIMTIPNMENFTFAMAYKNFGSDLKFVAEPAPLPQIFTMGLGYREDDFYNLKVALDFNSQSNSGNFFSVGASVTPIYFLSFRGGIKLSDESLNADLRLGIGFEFQSLSFDYSYTPSQYLNGTHNFNLSYAIGSFSDQRAAYDYYLMNHFREGVEFYTKKDFVSARRKFDEILSVYPEHRPSQRHLQKIIDELAGIDAYNARRVSGYMKKADNAINKGDAATASKYFRMVLEFDPENTFAKDGLDNVDEYTRKASIERDRMKNKDRIEYLWARSENFYRQGELVRAKESLNFILDIDPENQSAKDGIVNIDNALAKIHIDKVNEMYSQAMDLYNQGKFQEAIRYFEAIVIAAPHRRDAQDLISKAEKNIQEIAEYERQKKVEAAQEKVRGELYRMFETALKYYEKNNLAQAVVYFRRSKELADKYEFDDYSKNAQNYVTKISYDLSESHYRKGFELVRNNKFEAAAREYKTALSYNPSNTSASFEYERVGKELAQKYYEEGMSYYSKSDFDKARGSLKKALEYDPKKTEAKRALERLQ